jgi:carboxymethylenebutenolidase
MCSFGAPIANLIGMDIQRPDRKQARIRSRILWAALALILAITAGLFFWRKQPSLNHRYIALRHDSRTLQALVVSPKNISNASVVILVHEIYGLSDWATHMADELAQQGFIVIAPDLLSGDGPHGGGYNDFASEAERVSAISSLDHAAVMADLDAAVDFARAMPNANGKIAIAGFSWGGWKTFAFANHRKDLSAVFVFYGTGPDDVTGISAPVYGFYAGKDTNVNFSVPPTTAAMKAAGKFYEPVTYPGADHGFMRLGDDPLNRFSANRTAHNQAFARLIHQLKQMSSNEVPPS